MDSDVEVISPHTQEITKSVNPSDNLTDQEQEILNREEMIDQTKLFMEKFSNLAKNKNLPNTIFFLDKRARPLAYMFRKLYPYFCPQDEMPAIRFINIGRNSDEGVNTKERPFNGDPAIIRKEYGKYIDSNGSILVVDEYSSTGKTLENASKMISQAFPDATVRGTTAYNKQVLWKDEIGVEEFTTDDFQKKAVETVNEKYGTEYRSGPELQYASVMNGKQQHHDLYKTTLQNIDGAIPYTKRLGLRTEKPTLRHTLSSLARRVAGLREAEKVNKLRESRKELDTVCEDIIRVKKQENSDH